MKSLLPYVLLILFTSTSVFCKTSFYDLSAVDIEGNDVSFGAFRDKVVLVVNVASECGFTDDHYTQLQKMFQVLGQDDHFIILAFPCNQFGAQEPGSDKEILNLVHERFEVTFPIFSKVDVKGSNASPVWKFLVGKSGVLPEWNFYKYLIDHKGNVVDVFPSRTSVESIFDAVSKSIKKAKKAKQQKPKSVKKELKEEL